MGEGVSKDKKFTPLIVAIAIVVPLLVTILVFLPKVALLGDFDYSILPLFHAIINGTTFFLLLGGLNAIKNGKITVHKRFMTASIILSAIFLLSYVTYHAATEPADYKGSLGFIYYPVLISHILLSAAIVPLVLISYVRALSEKFDKHRKIARITLPLWLYVTFTGVIVYLMIAPYYI